MSNVNPLPSQAKSRAKLCKGAGHNTFGEPAWPNDLLFLFPICITGVLACSLGLAVLSPPAIDAQSDPFSTPLEILPEWYFLPSFNLLRLLPNKLLGVAAMASIPLALTQVAASENQTASQNPNRRSQSSLLYILGSSSSSWLGAGGAMPLSQSLTLALN
uniref:Cytochrome b6f subunit D n=1 Tax=Karenia brevis TaxID=156230 RepID=A0A0S2QDD5_KARBR|nr:cytochrome b6f subunit D [Karenia brevis]